MSAATSLRRQLVNAVALTGTAIAALLVVLPLVTIFGYLVYKGIGAINWDLLTKIPQPVGEAGGGLANGIVGSGLILLVASAIGIPVGIGSGVFLAEYGSCALQQMS
jgi:phosphate transport system permease protein